MLQKFGFTTIADSNFNNSNSWCVIEAKRIIERIEKTGKNFALFETGYGPSGLPHIGTFGEVFRTLMIMYATQNLAPDLNMKLYVVSDDLDGLRKVPTNVPNQDILKKYIGMPLTSVPDPFEEYESYGHYMNNKLKEFMNRFDFVDYDFISATEYYKNGTFNDKLIKASEKYEELMNLMIPTLGEVRQETYSPFMPICNVSGKVLAEGVIEVNKDTIKYTNSENEIVEQSFLNGGCKLQWKCDYGMRWAAFDVDYEIYGKEHMPNEKIYKNVCSILEGNPPETYFYELFLNHEGQKISKSSGNGITIDEWLKYSPKESMSLFMYSKPKTAKRLYFDVIPKMTDEYIAHRNKFLEKTDVNNPLPFIHFGNIPTESINISYNLLLNLVSACHAASEELIMKYIKRYMPSMNDSSGAFLQQMVKCALNYYNDFVLPNKKNSELNDQEKEALSEIKDYLQDCLDNSINPSGSDIQTVFYDVANKRKMDLKLWFNSLYKGLFGTEDGPRMGMFVELYGIKETIDLIDQKL